MEITKEDINNVLQNVEVDDFLGAYIFQVPSPEGEDYDNQFMYDYDKGVLHLLSDLTFDDSYSFKVKIKDVQHLKSIISNLCD